MDQYAPPPPPPPYAPPAAPPPAPEKKKGLPPLAWVGIGCGALLVIALIVFVAGSMFVAKKVRDVAGDFESNPAMAAAELAVRLDPNLELVESDQEAGTLTVRNKQTGEEMTFNLEQIEQGRLSVLTGEGEEKSFSVSQGEGGIEFTTEEGGSTSRIQIGAGSDEVPDWVPVYPGSEPAGTYLATTAEGAKRESSSAATEDRSTSSSSSRSRPALIRDTSSRLSTRSVSLRTWRSATSSASP